MVVEGLSLLINKDIIIGKFLGYIFKAGDHRFSHLQYTEDIIIISEKKWSNIQIVMEILLLFESMSYLKINCQKNSIVGINVPHY